MDVQAWEYVHSGDTNLRPSVCHLARAVILALFVRLLGLPRASGQQWSESGPLFVGWGLEDLAGWDLLQYEALGFPSFLLL